MNRKQIALALVAILTLPTALSAREAPDPLPSWSSLTPDSTEQVLYDVEDMIGNFMLLGPDLDKEVYVWDLAIAQLQDGTVVVYRYEFQDENGNYGAFDAGVNLPSGTTVLTNADSIYGSDYVYFTDEYGTIQLDLDSNFSSGEIGEGGVISFDPGHEFGPGRSTCGIVGGIWTCGNNCTWLGGTCTMAGGGWCGCSQGTCPLIRAAVECGGSCAAGNTCQYDNAGGCGCQPS